MSSEQGSLPPSPMIGWVAAVILALLLLGAGYALTTPLGEAPDEPAHISYVNELLRVGHPPSLPRLIDGKNYEAHQPPLDYAMSALMLRISGVSAISTSFEPAPQFRFDLAGSRAYRFNGSAEEGRVLQRLRLFRLLWLLLLVTAAKRLVTSLPLATRTSAALALLYLFTPQLLFIFAAINNDTAVTLFSTLALAQLLRLSEESSSLEVAIAAFFFAAALFAKASALLLVAPLLVVAWLLFKDGSLRNATVLVGTSLLVIVAWCGLSYLRFGMFLPPVPRMNSGALPSVLDLATHPRWIATLFRSYWAKFGAMNTPMPRGWYVLFAAASLLPLLGILRACRQPRFRRSGAILGATLLSNLALVVLFMLRVDWQPQGRYLFPSIGAVVGFAAIAIEGLLKERERRNLAVFLAVGIAVASAGLLVLRSAYP